MSHQELPHYKLKQSLLHNNETKPEELRRWGNKFLEQKWFNDAVDFFNAAKDIEKMLVQFRDLFL